MTEMQIYDQTLEQLKTLLAEATDRIRKKAMRADYIVARHQLQTVIDILDDCLAPPDPYASDRLRPGLSRAQSDPAQRPAELRNLFDADGPIGGQHD